MDALARDLAALLFFQLGELGEHLGLHARGLVEVVLDLDDHGAVALVLLHLFCLKLLVDVVKDGGHHFGVAGLLLVGVVDDGGARGWLVVLGVERGGRLHDGAESHLGRVAGLGLGGMGLEGGDQVRDALDEGVVDDSLVLVRLDLGLALLSLLVDLLLLCADKRLFVDIGVDFNVGVITELQRVLL